jgi:hypothetical protein
MPPATSPFTLQNFGDLAKIPRMTSITKSALAAAATIVAACGASRQPPKTADAPRPLPAPPPAASASAAPTRAVCDNDGPEPDCKTLSLGDCGAAVYYACPATAGLPADVGFRGRVASHIAACLARPGYDPSIEVCARTTEACVREAVGEACFDQDALDTCKRELDGCSPELQTLCAKFLSSFQPKTRVSALSDMRDQRRTTGDATTCRFNWDLDGFPFCPFCPFRP